jgi:hypothetical protein
LQVQQLQAAGNVLLEAGLNLRAGQVVSNGKGGVTATAFNDLRIDRLQAAGPVKVSAVLGDIDLPSVQSPGAVDVTASTGNASLQSVQADALSATGARIDIGQATLRSSLQLIGNEIHAVVDSGSTPLRGAITDIAGDPASVVDLRLSGAGGFHFSALAAQQADLWVPLGALAIDALWVLEQARIRNPLSYVLVGQDLSALTPADVQLYSGGKPFYLRLDGNQIGTDAFVVRRSPLHEITGPDGPVRSVAEVAMDTLTRVTLPPAPEPPAPRVEPTRTPLRFSGVPVSTQGLCDAALNTDCPK